MEVKHVSQERTTIEYKKLHTWNLPVGVTL